MGLFLKGLVTAFIGFMVWVIASIIEGLARYGTGAPSPMFVLVFIGFALMVGGPIAFWLVAPIVRLARRQ